jgi:hypothetical protein
MPVDPYKWNRDLKAEEAISVKKVENIFPKGMQWIA